MFHLTNRAVRAAIGVSTIAFAFAASPAIEAQKAPSAITPNYELASAWTTQRVSKLVFDTSVTPRWLETSDRFWYSYQTRDGRRFYLVDPVKKTKAPLFDHAKMAAALTTITRIPYDAQHLPFTQLRFIKNDAAFEFEVTVPRDADILTMKPKAITTDQQDKARNSTSRLTRTTWPATPQQGQRGQRAGADPAHRPDRRRGTKTLYFEYDIASGKVTLNEDRAADPRRPTLGHGVAGRQVGPLRPQPQPLHDGRRELGEGAEERQRHDDRRAPAHQGRRGALQLRRRRSWRRRYSSSNSSSSNSRSSRNRSSRSRSARTRTPRARRQPDLVAGLEQVRARPP